jgi:leucyl-tRNA synthetase
MIVQAAYDKLLFREALKVAAYDLGNARDVYRFACGPDGMNRALVQRYVEVSALLLAPITPHTSEHIWGSLLKKSGSVFKAGWPQAAEPDFIMQRAAQYIEGECQGNGGGVAGGEWVRGEGAVRCSSCGPNSSCGVKESFAQAAEPDLSCSGQLNT